MVINKKQEKYMSIFLRRRSLKPRNSQGNNKRPPIKRDAVTSVASNMAAWFLKESKEKGVSIRIPSLGVIVNSDGTEEKIKEQTNS
jgi:hypothetical protein